MFHEGVLPGAADGDTIVAVATPAGYAERGVIRLSGPAARVLAARLFAPRDGGPADPLPARGLHHGELLLPPEGLVCPVTLWVFRAPRSFTGEDMVELHLPGAPGLLQMVQSTLQAGGARPAGPGEFTYRAFLSGRIDLSRAEAVAALIGATDESQRRRSLALLDGGLARVVAGLRDRLLQILVPLELSLDFADQDVDAVLPPDPVGTLESLAADLRAHARGQAATTRPGTRRVVLEGPANAGKSTLFNSLLGRPEAIVSRLPGTTRDVLTGDLVLEDGQRVQLLDTAGKGVVGTQADRQAHRRRVRFTREADLVLEVRDARLEPGPPRRRRQRRLRVLTHRDLLPAPQQNGHVLLVSGVTGEGLTDLREAMARRLRDPGSPAGEAPVAVNMRQAAAFGRAGEAVRRAAKAWAVGGLPECAADDLHAALRFLREITGEEARDEVLAAIFSTFCIGK